MSIDAMKQALEALNDCTYDEEGYCLNPDNVDAILALRAAIEQVQEPVAHTLNCVCGAVWDVSPDGVEEMVHAPTPPPRQWQGLTDEELAEFSELKLGAYDLCLEVEAKLKEKNNAR